MYCTKKHSVGRRVIIVDLYSRCSGRRRGIESHSKQCFFFYMSHVAENGAHVYRLGWFSHSTAKRDKKATGRAGRTERVSYHYDFPNRVSEVVHSMRKRTRSVRGVQTITCYFRLFLQYKGFVCPYVCCAFV